MHTRHGFIILFGARTIVSNDAAAPVHTHCPRCGRETDIQSKSYRQWFTLFFVPIFPISRKQRFTQCPQCGAQFPIPAEELRERLAVSQQQQNEEVISLYNSLRGSPANSVTLNQLMQLYASLGEHDQAISAAAQFPQALHNSEQCMTTLGRVYLAKNQPAEALQWLSAAVERNPMLGEAQHHKALAHLMTTAPNYPAAIAAARAARSASYPGADALLCEAEAKSRGE